MQRKRTYGHPALLNNVECDERLLKKKKEGLEKVIGKPGFFDIKYWIDEEERWMLPSEHDKYLKLTHLTEVEYPVKYHSGGILGICMHCGVERFHHPFYDFVTNAEGISYIQPLRVCGTADKLFVAVWRYNKWTQSTVSAPEIFSELEYFESDKKTQ